ncbi:hypothetical protein [Rodentibacter caecimuris]|nr:hypothetical protein [Rodentibacter heylii]
MQNELTKKEQRLMRRWFRKTDENTIEIKEKNGDLLRSFLSL